MLNVDVCEMAETCVPEGLDAAAALGGVLREHAAGVDVRRQVALQLALTAREAYGLQRALRVLIDESKNPDLLA